MKKLLCFFLLAACSLSAQIFTGGFTFNSPFSGGLVSGTGGVVFQGSSGTEFTFSAPLWSITGGITLRTPGNYTITGSFNGTGGITGPANGTAAIRFVNGVNLTGSVASNVTVVTGNNPFPPQVTPPVTVPLPAGTAGAAPLVNISTRATLGAGQALTPGFVVGGTVARRVLVRAIGPGLAAFGVQGVAPSVTLAIFNAAGAQIGTNAGWGGGASLAAVFAGVGAFALAPSSTDAALLLTLTPGNYTARITGAGEVLAEIYFVD